MRSRRQHSGYEKDRRQCSERAEVEEAYRATLRLEVDDEGPAARLSGRDGLGESRHQHSGYEEQAPALRL